MGKVLCRIRVSEGGFATSQPTTLATGKAQDAIPVREWCIFDDCLNLCDTASVTVSNIGGENAKKFQLGMRVEIECSDEDVAGGEWVRSFTGLITRRRLGSDFHGSTIQLTCADVGWYLTSCHGRPLTNIRNRTFQQLFDLLLDPSWGISEIRTDNDLSRRLKHGRQVIAQVETGNLKQILPYIQVEPGQAPADIILTYAAREGLLVNATADGALVLFRPNYRQSALYRAVYEGDGGDSVDGNTVVGASTLEESIDGLYTRVDVFSTVVIPPAIRNTEDPNDGYTRSFYEPTDPPLPFARRFVMSDSEAINKTLRKNRAIWKQQMGMFESWTYEVDLVGHSQDGAFFVSDTMITVDDTVNDVHGVYYVQSVRRSQTVRDGTKTHLVIRKPLLNPELTELNYGGGAKKAAKVKPRGKAKLSPKLEALLGKRRAGK